MGSRGSAQSTGRQGTTPNPQNGVQDLETKAKLQLLALGISLEPKASEVRNLPGGVVAVRDASSLRFKETFSGPNGTATVEPYSTPASRKAKKTTYNVLHRTSSGTKTQNFEDREEARQTAEKLVRG